MRLKNTKDIKVQKSLKALKKITTNEKEPRF